MNLFTWIETELTPTPCPSTELIYDHMESQSGRCLPVIYQPFDAGNRSHWRDRGSLFDFLYSTGGGRVLDFGPGDGWPSLILAPYVNEVVGVDGSARRVQVCTANAKRLGITNATFIHTAPGEPLPFADDSYDGATAASSVEQTPDPQAALWELFRVLRPGGRLRVSYEALSRYRGGEEQALWLCPIDSRTSRLLLYDRDIARERVRHYAITFRMSREELTRAFGVATEEPVFAHISVSALEKLRSKVVEAHQCTLTHPSGTTLTSWLKEAGFREVLPTRSGAELAGRLFDETPKEQRPEDIEGVDALLQDRVREAVNTPAPIETDPMITAVK